MKKDHSIVIDIIGILGFFAVLSILIYIVMTTDNSYCCMCGEVTNDCCPCPNKALIKPVEKYTGQEASSAGSWLIMCEKYKKATNDTRECFE